MNRRSLLAGVGLVSLGGFAGCVGRIPGRGLSTEFELGDPTHPPDDPPDVTVDGEKVRVRGTVEHGSSSCGTVELAHAAFEGSQRRVDFLVVAADDSGVLPGCTEDLVHAGYRLDATSPQEPRRVSVTEHHVFGETYSTTVDLTDD
mgnify:CR=1 FL=1